MRTVLQPGKEYDFLTPQEMHKGLNDMQGRLVDALVREELRGIKYLKYKRVLPPHGGDFILGPASGYMWSILVISAVPFTNLGSYGSVNFSISPRNDTPGTQPGFSVFDSEWCRIVSAYSDIDYSKGQLMVTPENSIFVINNDAVNTMVARVAIVEVPAEMIGKLYI